MRRIARDEHGAVTKLVGDEAATVPILPGDNVVVEIRANAEDALFMIPAAAALRKRYRTLDVPVAILAGAADRVVDPDSHARELHGELRNSELVVLRDVGHMLHHVAPDEVVAAIRSS